MVPGGGSSGNPPFATSGERQRTKLLLTGRGMLLASSKLRQLGVGTSGRSDLDCVYMPADGDHYDLRAMLAHGKTLFVYVCSGSCLSDWIVA